MAKDTPDDELNRMINRYIKNQPPDFIEAKPAYKRSGMLSGFKFADTGNSATYATGETQPTPKPEPEMLVVDVRIHFGSHFDNNKIEWNAKDEVLDAFYLNGFIPQIMNISHKRIDDETIRVSINKDLLEHIKSRKGMVDIRGLGPVGELFSSPSPIAYQKHPIGMHACKYSVPPVEADKEDIAKLREQGLLPEGYEFGNAPFDSQMCTHPKMTAQDNNKITHCHFSGNQTACNVYEKDQGTPVEILSKVKGTSEGLKVRTHNPYRGDTRIEIFDSYGDRFPLDIQHNILPKEIPENVETDSNSSPLLKNYSVS